MGGDNLRSPGGIKKIKKATFVSFFSIHSFTVFIEIRTNPSLEIPTDKYTDATVLFTTVPVFATKTTNDFLRNFIIAFYLYGHLLVAFFQKS